METKKIINSSKEPRKEVLWLKDNKLYNYGPNGWESISGGGGSNEIIQIGNILNLTNDSTEEEIMAALSPFTIRELAEKLAQGDIVQVYDSNEGARYLITLSTSQVDADGDTAIILISIFTNPIINFIISEINGAIGIYKDEILLLEQNSIQDNLTTTSPNLPLSANQGRVLKGLIDSKVIKFNKAEDLTRTSTSAQIQTALGLSSSRNMSALVTDLRNGAICIDVAATGYKHVLATARTDTAIELTFVSPTLIKEISVIQNGSTYSCTIVETSLTKTGIMFGYLMDLTTSSSSSDIEMELGTMYSFSEIAEMVRIPSRYNICMQGSVSNAQKSYMIMGESSSNTIEMGFIVYDDIVTAGTSTVSLFRIGLMYNSSEGTVSVRYATTTPLIS